MAGKRTTSDRKIRVSSTVVFLIQLLALVTLSACDLLPRPPAPSSADYCNIQTPIISDPNDVSIKVWASAPRQHCLRLYATLIAAENVAGVSVTPVEMNLNSKPYDNALFDAVRSNDAPDIAFVYHKLALDLANEGALYPIEKCGFTTRDWMSDIFRISDWALPFEADIKLLFYSKVILRQLGWSEEKVQGLPESIANGTVVLDDLFAISQQALGQNLIKQGFAFTIYENRFATIIHLYQQFDDSYSRNTPLAIDKYSMSQTLAILEQAFTSKISHTAFNQKQYSNITNRLALRDALAHGRILFAHASASEWTRMLLDHITDEELLNQNIGMALLPSIKRHRPGTAILRATGSYVIFNKSATRRNNQNASCQVLVALNKTKLDRAHASRINQIAPAHNTIWTPSRLPVVTPNNLHPSYLARPRYALYKKQIENAVAQLALKQLTLEQAATTASRPPIIYEQP